MKEGIKSRKDLIRLHNLNFLYLDCEYLLNGRKISHKTELFTIQYAIFTMEDLRKRTKPKLTILCRWDYNNQESELLKQFNSIWKRITLGLGHVKKIVPIGYVIGTDLELLRYKYAQNGYSVPLSIDLLVTSRMIDLKNYAIAETGLIDPQLVTYMAFIDPSKSNLNPVNMRFLLEGIKNSKNEVGIEKAKTKAINYIKAEFDENFTVIEHLFNRPYKFSPESEEARAIDRQLKIFLEKVVPTKFSKK